MGFSKCDCGFAMNFF